MRVKVEHGDSREVLKGLADCSVASIVTDPPYALVSITKRFGKPGSAPVKLKKIDGQGGSPYARGAKGFMGKTWDVGDTAFDPEFWGEALRVLKPGGHVLAFGGTRTYHRLVCAIEDAGFEIRDTISWNFGSGFPKSHNIGKKLDEMESRCSCDPVRKVRDGVSSAAVSRSAEPGGLLQPVMPSEGARGTVDPVCGEQLGKEEPKEGQSRRKKSSVEGRGNAAAASGKLRERKVRPVSAGSPDDGEARRLRDGASAGNGAMGGTSADSDRDRAPHRPQASEQRTSESGTVAGQPESQTGRAWPVCGGCGKPIVPDGLGTALKPAMELICVGRKPLIGTVAGNVLEHGTGALNIEACRVETADDLNGGAYSGDERRRDEYTSTDSQAGAVPLSRLNRGVGEYAQPLGRWPANVVHDGSDEVIEAFPNAAGQQRAVTGRERAHRTLHAYGDFGRSDGGMEPRGDAGSAARFFYSSKADADDRLGSKHPTVKPVDLMRWLVRLVTPPGGLVLDPFAGSGSTGMACLAEGFDCLLIEREAEYVADIRRRLAHVRGDDTPLFSGPT